MKIDPFILYSTEVLLFQPITWALEQKQGSFVRAVMALHVGTEMRSEVKLLDVHNRRSTLQPLTTTLNICTPDSLQENTGHVVCSQSPAKLISETSHTRGKLMSHSSRFATFSSSRQIENKPACSSCKILDQETLKMCGRLGNTLL